MHPNERLLRREYDARAQRDDASLAALLTEAVVWHVPGRSAISGEYRGKDEVMEYVRRRRDLAADTFEITVHDVLANDEHGFVIASGRAKATRQGGRVARPRLVSVRGRQDRRVLVAPRGSSRLRRNLGLSYQHLGMSPCLGCRSWPTRHLTPGPERRIG
jgi:ketosteroid isomerase-like protein